MKKLLVIAIFAILCCALTACMNPLHRKNRPFAQPGTVWTTDDGSVELTILNDSTDVCSARCRITQDGQEHNLYVRDSADYWIILFPAEHEYCKRNISGGYDCEHDRLETWFPDYSMFSNSSFTATVKYKQTFYPEGTELSFHRVD